MPALLRNTLGLRGPPLHGVGGRLRLWLWRSGHAVSSMQCCRRGYTTEDAARLCRRRWYMTSSAGSRRRIGTPAPAKLIQAQPVDVRKKISPRRGVESWPNQPRNRWGGAASEYRRVDDLSVEAVQTIC